MLQLHDKNKRKIAGLVNYENLCIESVLSTGYKTLSFSYPKNSKHYDEIIEEGFIRTKENEFVIKSRDICGDYTKFECILNLDELEGNIFDRFESVEQTITAALNLAIVGTGWTVKDNTLKKKRTVRCVNKSSLEIVQEIKRTYRVDIVFNTLSKQIEIYEHLGEDKGTYFIDSLNLTALQVQSDSYKFATRIIAEGKDGLTFSSINNGKNYVENYQYSRKVKTIYWKDERYTIKENLLEDAKAKLKEISKPFVSYNASILNLAELNPKYKSILDYSLGDTITLISKNNKVKDKQRIVKTIEYPQDHSRDTVELANAVLKFEDIQQENQETTNTVSNITVDNGTIDGSTIDGIKVKQIEDFKANILQVTNLHALNADIDYLKVNKADMQDVNIVKAKIGTLETTKANITELNSLKATLQQAIIMKADITDLNAVNGKINVLESKTASIDNLLAGNLTANNFKANSIVAGSGIIADGAIGSAQISSLSVNKLEAGEFITSKHKIVSADGTIEIVGNQILINRNNVNRVVLGEYRKKDGTTEYGLLVRAKDGQTVMLDGNGVHNAGITDGAIDNNKVADNANILGNKLDINSVIREVNTHGTETIKGTKVTIGDRTLDVELSTQKNTITEHGKELSNQKATIQALDSAIKLKVDSQTFSKATETINGNINKAKQDAINTASTDATNKANNALNSAKTFVNSEINTVNTHLNKNTSEINILKEKIESKVSQTDIDKSIQEIKIGGRNLYLRSKIINRNDWGNISHWNTETINGFTMFSSDTSWFGVFQNITLEAGEFYTLSAWVKGDGHSTIYDFFEPDGEKCIHITRNYTSGMIAPKEWTRIYTTYKVLKETENIIRFENSIQGSIIKLYGFKLEKGNKATDYTQAPEDTNSLIADNIKIVTDKITTVESKFTQENNSIKASVSDLNSTTQSITTNVSNINRDLTSKINSNLDVAKNFATDKANAAKQEAITGARSIPDTRNDNQPPSWYMKNFPNQTLTEFKYADVIQVSDSKVYGTLETTTPWWNASGGYPTQIFRSNSTATFHRHGINETTWSSWEQIENTQGSQTKANEALNNAKAFVNAEITTVNSKVHNLESGINILKDQIKSKVSQSDIDKSIKDVKFGYRNLIPNSYINAETNIYGTFGRTLTANLEAGETYCFSIRGHIDQIASNNNKSLACYIYEDTWNYGSISITINSVGVNQTKHALFVPKKTGVYKFATYMYPNGGNREGKVCLEWAKLVKGNRTTDEWIPAPEDTNSLIVDNIRVVDTKISDVSSTVTQLKNSVTTEINSINSKTTTLNGKIVNAETRLNSVEAKITDSSIINVVRTQFYSKGETDNMYSSKTEVTQLSNSLEWKISTLGAGNLIKNSSFEGGFDCWERFRNPTLSTNTEFLKDSYGKMISIEGDGGIFQRFPTIVGEKYTVSFYAEANQLKPLATTIGIEGINLITLKFEPGWKRWSFTFTATSKEHTFIAYLGQYGKFYLGRVMVTQGSILQEYREGLGIYSNVAKFDTNGFTVESSSTNTRTITDSAGFRVQDKRTGENLLEANTKGVSARGGRFYVDGPNGNYTLMWGRDIVINGQRAIVGTHSHPEASLKANKMYLNYNNDFRNGVEIAGDLTNNTFPIPSLIGAIKGENGFRKLSDGFMIVWGKAVMPIKEGKVIEGTIPFHTKFPNACFLFNAKLAKVDGNDYWAGNYTLNSYPLDKFGGRVYGLNMQKYISTQGAWADVYYFAIGC